MPAIDLAPPSRAACERSGATTPAAGVAVQAVPGA